MKATHHLPPATSAGPNRRIGIGWALHQAITGLALAVHPDIPTVSDIRAEVNILFAGNAGPAVRGAKVDCITSVALYVANAWPPPSWTLVEIESTSPSRRRRADLWWRTGSGFMVADELKLAHALNAAMVAQAQAQILEGQTRWGDRVAGARLVLAGDPTQSRWCPAVGVPVPLADTVWWFGRTPARTEARP